MSLRSALYKPALCLQYLATFSVANPLQQSTTIPYSLHQSHVPTTTQLLVKLTRMGRSKKYHYDPSYQQQLQAISLPSKIKCSRCEKHYNPENYSAKQLTDAKENIKAHKSNPFSTIKCRRCTGSQVVEIECTKCGITKGIEEFAKIQRTRPDEARCYRCMNKQTEQEAVSEYSKHNAFLIPDYSAGKAPEYWNPETITSLNTSQADDHNGSDEEDGGISITSKMSTLSVDAKPLIDTTPWGEERDKTGGPVQGGEDTIGTSSWHTKSLIPSIVAGGFDPRAYGSRVGSSVAGSAKSSGPKFIPPDDMKSKNGWAKIPAYKPPPVPESEPEEEDDWPSESDNDDSDGDEEDF
ncbi:Stc1 domain-containing protein [Dendryphion nanum]|uniref:Stc1 domain-containing protein n=1 Tax=Dendryphion nanum TaxID=256645 RepID=A0A9P9DAJ8_9PLEO|nr:Stc1 domain-containing protein [Dendryphion nanum]